MKKTFLCNEGMIITIPIGSVKNISRDPIMPEHFQCVYRDFYKVFVVNGKPKALGAAQAITGVFLVALSAIITDSPATPSSEGVRLTMLPSLLFVVSGLLSYAAGRSPNMHVTKLSFSLNIISLLWSLVAVVFNACTFSPNLIAQVSQTIKGIFIMIELLLAAELFITLYLIYWLSKAVCRQHFNTLPMILLKRGD